MQDFLGYGRGSQANGRHCADTGNLFLPGGKEEAESGSRDLRGGKGKPGAGNRCRQ